MLQRSIIAGGRSDGIPTAHEVGTRGPLVCGPSCKLTGPALFPSSLACAIVTKPKVCTRTGECG